MHPGGQVLEKFFQLEQQHADNGDCRGDPQLVARHQRPDHIRDEAGDFRGYSGFVVRFEFVFVGKPQERADLPGFARERGRAPRCFLSTRAGKGVRESRRSRR